MQFSAGHPSRGAVVLGYLRRAQVWLPGGVGAHARTFLPAHPRRQYARGRLHGGVMWSCFTKPWVAAGNKPAPLSRDQVPAMGISCSTAKETVALIARCKSIIPTIAICRRPGRHGEPRSNNCSHFAASNPARDLQKPPCEKNLVRFLNLVELPHAGAGRGARRIG